MYPIKKSYTQTKNWRKTEKNYKEEEEMESEIEKGLA